MKRRLLNVLTALSLLLCVAVVVLWVLSYWGVPDLKWGNGRDSGFGWRLYDHELSAYEGELYYSRCYGPAVYGWGPGSATSSRFLGVGVDRGYWSMVPDSDIAPYRRLIMVPLYWLVLSTLPMTATYLWQHRRILGRLQRPGLCAFCGYDLRATPGRCPECGYTPSRA